MSGDRKVYADEQPLEYIKLVCESNRLKLNENQTKTLTAITGDKRRALKFIEALNSLDNNNLLNEKNLDEMLKKPDNAKIVAEDLIDKRQQQRRGPNYKHRF